MALQKFTLPRLKLTHRPAFGKKSVGIVPREVVANETLELSEEGASSTMTPDVGDILFDDGFSPEYEVVEPTGHELESRSSVEGWEAIRIGLRNVVTESAAMPLEQKCFMCCDQASLRCPRCGPLGFYCCDCFKKAHCHVNVFHVAEKWEDDHYCPVLDAVHCINVRPHHLCTTKRDTIIQCIDEHGIEHKVNFIFCGCEPLPITMARAQLWPATPRNPRYAFSFALLDWAEALMLECQVALKDFCASLKLRCPISIPRKRDIYSSLIDAFEEYRFLKGNLRHLTYLSSELDFGDVCPACPHPQDINSDNKFVYSMDALFGLPRKKSAGVSHRGPLRDNFFCDQTQVDQFVADSVQPKSSTECNEFLAGSMLRSASRYRALDETAVFGYACRHEFPGKFISLKHGERLAYGVWLMDKIVASAQHGQVFVMYDIACNLHKHLQGLGRSDLLENSKLCLPAFHCYGHKVSCQVKFGPRRCEGIGLSDGETMERLWSYLRRFGRMTKEMRPSHRIDVLCSALTHYGYQTKVKLASLLVMRWERAQKTKQVAEETLHERMPAFFHGKKDDVQKWLADELVCSESKRPKLTQWQTGYFLTLHAYYSLRQLVSSGGGGGCGGGTRFGIASYTQLKCLEGKLVEIESRHSISPRWLQSDTQYKECQYAILFSKKEQLLLEMWKSSQRRLFLLDLKRKYADGQKIAKKLGIQIGKETRSIKVLLTEYNAPSDEDQLSLVEVLNIQEVEARLQKYSVTCTLATGEKRVVIDAYLALCRSEEELAMLSQEAKNIATYYKKKKVSIEGALKRLSLNLCSFSRGAKSLLYLLLQNTSTLLEQGLEVVKLFHREHTPVLLEAEDSEDDCSDDGFSDDET